jgi:rare lipoprotein A
MQKLIITILSLFLIGCATDSAISDTPEEHHKLNTIYQGNATWYSSGHITASGKKFNPNELTVAHRTLPFGTILKLINPENGNSIKAVVTDRGPFKKDRVLDVSKSGAVALGFYKKGKAKLHYEIMEQPQ